MSVASDRICAHCGIAYPDGTGTCPDDGYRLITKAEWQDSELDPLVGAPVDGRYVLLSKLANGGMGNVYIAEHTAMGRQVAIKMLSTEICDDEVLVERFRREARNSSQLQHPNTVRVFDFGTNGQHDLFLVMELLEGQTLNQVIKRGAVPGARALHIAEQIARAVAEAHAKGIVHRDLKPANIQLIEVDGDPDFVKVLDFGLAKLRQSDLDGLDSPDADQSLTGQGSAIGTPLYMSPEQCSGESVDGRTDIYALGCILFELIAGRPPFKGENPVRTLTMHIRDEVPRLADVVPDTEVPTGAQAFIDRCMRKDPDERYQTMDEAALALAALEAGQDLERTARLTAARAASGIVELALDETMASNRAVSASQLALELARRGEDSDPVGEVAPRSPLGGTSGWGQVWVAAIVAALVAGGLVWWFDRQEGPIATAGMPGPPGAFAPVAPPPGAPVRVQYAPPGGVPAAVPPPEVTVVRPPVVVRVTGSPEGARVRVDGRLAGTVPTEYSALPLGSDIEVSVDHEGHFPFARRVSLDAVVDGVLPVSVQLEPIPAAPRATPRPHPAPRRVAPETPKAQPSADPAPLAPEAPRKRKYVDF